ncbi:beclin 1-associated autophagy-related key regulator-like isoform X2 [Xenia sp. Carnegie-2017]|uniref:beclin 1-associated autophagy-related key regulator-like isoform X2 n=1 Tax=Xenia sp. Carnegie-2017 TaxID=2897299 RepID=UPI001F043977|nr:beclin 1-associated autophagy-related key regulator-like isoform X2 [Xenia sp. Carnegie-2017]
MAEEIGKEIVVYHDGFCPLCSRKRRVFTCPKCITLGLFSKSNEARSESYEKKRQRLESTKKLKLESSDRVLQLIKNCESKNDIKCKLLLLRCKVSAIHEAIDKLKWKHSEDKGILSKTTEENKRRRSRLDLLKQQIKTQEKQLHSKNVKIQQRLTDLADQQQQVVTLRRIYIDQVQKYLFPIEKRSIFPEPETPPGIAATHCNASDVALEGSDSYEKALSEATRTSYVEGKWLTYDETQYKILETFLPVNGNYSSYSQWLRTCELKSSGFCYTAGLSYACQLLDLSAFFLDVTLPRNVTFGDFCLRDLSASELKSAVVRLNTNVMYLCMSQNVNPQMLHPAHTLQNLRVCLNPDNMDLGRFTAHCTDGSNDHVLLNDADVDSSDEDLPDGNETHNLELYATDTEWETITIDSPVPSAVTQNATSRESENETIQSSASSFVSSVTSLWPWKS